MKALISIYFFLLAFLINAAAQTSSPQPVASVIDVIGTVSVSRAGKTGALNLFDNLFAGDVVNVGKGATLFLAHNAAKSEYSATVQSEFEIVPDGVKPRSGTAPSAKKLSDFAAAAVVVPTSGGKTSVGAVRMRSMVPPETSPSNRDTIITLNPAFSWPPFSPGMTYIFTLAQSNVVIAKIGTKDTSVRLTAGQSLDWGVDYEWTLTIAENTDKPPVVRNFKTIDRATLDSLLPLTPSDKATFSESVVYARALEKVGAFGAAREVWRRLAISRPGNKELVGLTK